MGDGLKDIRTTVEPCESLSSGYNMVIRIMNPAAVGHCMYVQPCTCTLSHMYKHTIKRGSSREEEMILKECMKEGR